MRCAQCLLPVRVRALRLRVGEALEPFCCYGCYLVLRVTSERGPGGAAHGLALRLGLALFFAMNAMMFSLPGYFPYVYGSVAEGAAFLTVLRVMALLLTLPVLILLGGPVLWQALRDARELVVRTDALVAIGTVAAYAVSVHHTVVGAPHVYFDTVAMLLIFVAIGRYLEARAKADAGAVLANLRAAAQPELRVSRAGRWQSLHADALQRGDVIALGPGDTCPADGIIDHGRAHFDESTLTGESAPISKTAGSVVSAGSTNLDGTVHVRAERVGEASTIGRLARSVEDALNEPSPWQHTADRLAAVLVVTTPLLALGTFAYWAQHTSVEHALLTALAVLVVACPCAFGIATPAALWAGIDVAAQHGILLRSAGTLERLARIRTVWFDKTGTLSTGRLRLTGIEHVSDATWSQPDILAIARALESGIPHPIAVALGIPTTSALTATDVRYHPGLGVEGRVHGQRWLLGSESFVATDTAHTNPADDGPLPALRAGSGLHSGRAVDEIPFSERREGTPAPVGAGSRGDTSGWSAWLAHSGDDAQPTMVARLTFSDVPRADATAVVQRLRADGMSVGILSGASTLGADWRRVLGSLDARVGLLPDEKAAQVRASPRPVAMVGDGLNDAPALAAADVGIAVGTGRDLTREAAQVNILSNDLSAVVWLFHWSRRVHRTILGNIGWALTYNAVALATAATGVLNPVIAALAMIGSSGFIIANSRRLRRRARSNERRSAELSALGAPTPALP